MEASFEKYRPSINDEVGKAKESVRDIYTQLELASLDEVTDLVDEAMKEEVSMVQDRLDGLASMVTQMPFDNPAQRDAFVRQISEVFAQFSFEASSGIDDRIDETERTLLTELINNINGVIDAGMTLESVGTEVASRLDLESKEFTLTREDESSNLGDLLKGADRALVSFDAFFYQAYSRQIAVLTRLYDKTVPKGMMVDKILIVKGVDGNMYLASGNGRIIENLPPLPALSGMQIRTKTYSLPTEPNEIVFECEPGSMQESRQRIDTIIDNPFVKKAEITYTDRSIGIYKEKYPDFPYEAGAVVSLVCGEDRRFYFDNGNGEPDKDLPRAFIFSGDRLNYEEEIDTIDKREGELVVLNMNQYVDEAFAIAEKAEAFYQKHGIRLKYTKEDLDKFSRDYAGRRKSVDKLGITPKSRAEVVAAIDYFDSILTNYGPDFVKGDVATIYISGSFDKHMADSNQIKELGGVYLGEGRIAISSLTSTEHELFHAAERATAKRSRVDGGDWFVDESIEGIDKHDHSDGDHDHIETATTAYDYTEVPTPEEFEKFYRSGATSEYSYKKGIEGDTNEIQAEMWEFLRTEKNAAEILSKREGGQYAYPKLRENAAVILSFAYKKSGGHMDYKYWKAKGEDAGGNQNFDEDLWHMVVPNEKA